MTAQAALSLGALDSKRDFGCRGDGSSVDTTRLQSFFDACAETGRPGYLRPTTEAYMVDNKLRPEDGVVVYGKRGYSTIKATPDHPSLMIQNKTATGNSNITLRNIKFDGNYQNRPDAVTGFKAAVVFSAAAGDGITYLGTCNNITIEGCEVVNSPGPGIALQNARNCVTRFNLVHESIRDGISHFFDCQDCIVIGNRIYNCGDDFLGFNAVLGTLSTTPMRGFTITGNVLGGGQGYGVYHSGNGISLRGLQDSTISGNVVREAFSAGIGVANCDYQPAIGLVIANNALIDCGLPNSGGAGFGISLEGATPIGSTGGTAGIQDIKVQGNYIRNPRSIGISWKSYGSAGTFDGIDITENRIIGSGSQFATARGINFGDGSDASARLRVAGNVVRGFPSTNIFVRNSTTPIVDVKVEGNQSYDCQTSVGIRVGYTTSPIIRNNSATDTRSGGSKTQTYGLWLDNLTGAVVNGNALDGNLTGPVTVTSSTLAPHQAYSGIEIGAPGSPRIIPYTGNPEGVVDAPSGSIVLPSAGGTGGFCYLKQSPLGTLTGWGPLVARTHVEAAGGSVMANLLTPTDANFSYLLIGNGKQQWGAGGASALDTNFYRQAAATLKTDGNLIVAGTLTATAATQSAGDNSTKLATTAYVDTGSGLLVPKSLLTTKGDLIAATASATPARLAAGSNGLPLVADSAQTAGLKYAALTDAGVDAAAAIAKSKLAALAIVDADVSTISESKVTGLTSDLAAKAPLASPALTGSPTAPTQSASDNSTKISTTAYVDTASGLLVPKSLVTTKGDLIVATAASTPARVAVGANGLVLTADSTQGSGVKWTSGAWRSRWRPTSSIAENIDRVRVPITSTVTIQTGVLMLFGGLELPAGVPVSTITFHTGGSALAGTITHQWFALVRPSDLMYMAVTADDGATAWALNADKTLTLSATYTPAVDESMWLGLMCVVSGGGNLRGFTQDATLAAKAPFMAATSSTGLTGPATVGTTAGALTATTGQAWGCVS